MITMNDLTIRSNIRNYKVIFTEGFSFKNHLQQLDNTFFIVDRKVFRLHRNLFSFLPKDRYVLFDALEENKTIDSAISLYRTLLAKDMRRNSTLVSVGGGITQDVTGFVASTLYRGIDWIFVPTTLLAQVDSCIGSKTSLNFSDYKNVLGTFYPPSTIYIDAGFLDTLSEMDTSSGMGELIKFFFLTIQGEDDLRTLPSKITQAKQEKRALLEFIRGGLLIKKEFIEKDEFDTSKRHILNYGHTLGHALEATSNYAVPHGLAVLIGILFVNLVSMKRGLIQKPVFDFATNEILLPNLYLDTLKLKSDYFEPQVLFEKMQKDKKKTGAGLTLILPKAYFDLHKVNDLYFEELVKTVSALKHILRV